MISITLISIGGALEVLCWVVYSLLDGYGKRKSQRKLRNLSLLAGILFLGGVASFIGDMYGF
jgi:hypothetical protein